MTQRSPRPSGDVHSRTDPSRRHLAGLIVAPLLVTSLLVTVGVGSRPAAAAPTPVEQADLRLSEVEGTQIARGGAPGRVSASVLNEGQVTATGVRVRYRLPTGIDLAPEASSDCTEADGLVTCIVGTILPGGSAPVSIAVLEPSPTAVLGTRTGYFLAPTSDQFDAGAGELAATTWYHEAGAEGTDLAGCWPITNPTPLMDVAGGICDGVNDAAALEPDELTVLDAFPEPFSESLVRSWQFETEIVAPASGQFRACGTMIDDGGHMAIVPVGDALTPASIVVNVVSYDTDLSDPFPLVGGQRYRVVMRVVNRGFDGLDNGADGGTLAGWDAFGLAPADEPCDTADAAVFGTADTAWVDRTVADVVVAGASDLRVLGAVESAPVDGKRQASIRIANVGPDDTTARVAIDLPAGAAVAGPIDGCTSLSQAPSATCDLDVPASADADGGVVLSFDFVADLPGLGWSLTAASTVDRDTSDNQRRSTVATP